AQIFVQRLSAQTGKRYRLPSEAEWEYAARAGSTGDYSFGSDPSQLGQHGWFRENSGRQTRPVGQKLANGFGLHDVHGNVWEWVQDCWNASYAGAPTDGSASARGDCSRRLLRGGSWSIFPEDARAANRSWNDATYRIDSIGFRVARTD
ncbi:MAG: formylglycine-generating enzyme family protein, partial [Betaproteobacteria bacterium]|nr:formylglycine-generating enzyme family protein [Betaproteobacteria bacterium]